MRKVPRKVIPEGRQILRKVLAEGFCGRLRERFFLIFRSRSIFQPSAENLPGTFRGTFRKNLPRNLPQNLSTFGDYLPQNPPRNLPQNLPQKQKFQKIEKPSAEPSGKTFREPSARTFRKICLPSGITFRGNLSQKPSTEPSA